MIKKILIALLALFIIIGIAVFLYRYAILGYSAETIIRKLLPDYVTVDTIFFDFNGKNVTLGGFRILNPPGFSNRYLAEIDKIVCAYKMKGANILNGLEITDPIFKKPVLSIERLGNGKVNLQEMQKVVENLSAPKVQGQGNAKESTGKKETKSSGMVGNKRLSDIVKLPENFIVEKGKLIITDRLASADTTITLENIEATLTLKLDDSYSRVLSVTSTGEGNLNGREGEVIKKWVIVFNPNTPRLTMSNRFEVSNLTIRTFEPYYDKYSPFVFTSGKFSGTLIFDFDNGRIGSTNEVRLRDLSFSIKRGYENAQILEASVRDLAKYFTSSSGAIVFDFKIKGEMSNPELFPGPISKQALVSMAVDKGLDTLKEISKRGEGTADAEGKKSDLEKAKEYIDMFKGLMDKKK